MDIHYDHRAEISVVRACLSDDANDLLAVGGEHSVDVLRVTDTGFRTIASFHTGTRITALAWSSNTISPTAADEWAIELAASGEDYGLYLLTKSADAEEHIFSFGGGLSGHHGRVNDMIFCGGWDEDSARYVATVSDDKMLMVWDLLPTVNISSSKPSPARSTDLDNCAITSRSQPTAYVIPFPHPLVTIDSHPSTSKEFLVADCHGSIYLTDWRSDPDDPNRDHLRHSNVMEFADPHALAMASMGNSVRWTGSAAWRADSPDIIGAVYGSKFSIWDISHLRGGLPLFSSASFSEGGHRWCRTYPEYFAISTQSPNKGAVIHVHNFNYVHAQPTAFNLHARPHYIKDFDFMATRGIPRIAAAVGREVVVFSIGVES
ncbi:hypothetical protein BDQ17DRAFT_1327033 [Cyathus striatus]|nr:hypothetical protein BDQ17DRAFT_1327033 [Cyathus striatus]